MANYISVNAAAQTGADFTLTATDAVTLLLIDGTTSPTLPKNASARVLIKTSGNNYMIIGTLTSSDPAVRLEGAGTYQVQTAAGFGVDKT